MKMLLRILFFYGENEEALDFFEVFLIRVVVYTVLIIAVAIYGIILL